MSWLDTHDFVARQRNCSSRKFAELADQNPRVANIVQDFKVANIVQLHFNHTDVCTYSLLNATFKVLLE